MLSLGERRMLPRRTHTISLCFRWEIYQESHLVVPRKGLEPPRCYSLVPETSASTNSATWAFQERKALYQEFRTNQRLAGRV